MQLRRRPSEHAEVAAESMNDIMFFLMLFFLIISTLANPNVVKVILPQASVSKQMSKQPVIVSVRPSEEDANTPEYYIGEKLVLVEKLEEALREEVKKTEDATIVVRMDKSLTVKDLKKVLDIGQILKIKMVLASSSNGG